jgi:hypothetical protein
MLESGQSIPSPRSLSELTGDAEIARDLHRYMVAFIPFPDSVRSRAAE